MYKKIIPGRNTGDVLIKVFLTIKPYPMKNQIYIRNLAIPEIGLLIINALGTYFKEYLGKPLKNPPRSRMTSSAAGRILSFIAV